jgi:predicted GNAT family N-acyltransferase
MLFHGAIFRAEQLLITCELLYVFADPATQTSKPVPDGLRRVIEGFEAGEPVVDVRVGGWSELGRDASALRTRVFVNEQRIPADLEWDEADKDAVHAVAYNRLGQVVATGRLLQAEPGVAKIGRMAVHEVLRGSGYGQQVLHALSHAATARGDREVVLHAQRTAAGFYKRLGFQVRGEPFEEAGIPHIEMAASLPLVND